MAPVGRPRFLRYFNVTLILLWIHTPLFTVFWYMPSSNASCGSVKSAGGTPNFFQFLYLAIAKTSFLTKNLFRKLHLMPTLVLPSSFFSLLAFLLLVISSNPRLHGLWTSKLLNFEKHRILHLRSCASSTTTLLIIHRGLSYKTSFKILVWFHMNVNTPNVQRSIDNVCTSHER